MMVINGVISLGLVCSGVMLLAAFQMGVGGYWVAAGTILGTICGGLAVLLAIVLMTFDASTGRHLFISRGSAINFGGVLVAAALMNIQGFDKIAVLVLLLAILSVMVIIRFKLADSRWFPTLILLSQLLFFCLNGSMISMVYVWISEGVILLLMGSKAVACKHKADLTNESQIAYHRTTLL